MTTEAALGWLDDFEQQTGVQVCFRTVCAAAGGPGAGRRLFAEWLAAVVTRHAMALLADDGFPASGRGS